MTHGSLCRRFAPMAALLLTAVGCTDGDRGWSDPRPVVDTIIAATTAGRGETIYDLLDSARRAQIDTVIGAQMANIEKLPPEERPMWEALKGKSRREIWAQVMKSDLGVRDLFNERTEIVAIDTVVAVTVESGGSRDLLYLRWRDGGWKLGLSPEARSNPGGMPRTVVAPPGAGATPGAAPPAATPPTGAPPAGR